VKPQPKPAPHGNPSRDSGEDSGIRKAAILVASLDRSSADGLLDTLDPKQAQRVRQAVMELGPLDPREQRRVIDEFVRVQPLVPKKSLAGLDLGGGFARPPDPPHRRRLSEPTVRPPFRLLGEAEAEKLAQVLAGERPQIIALVLSHLPAQRAGSVLGRLPPPLQVEVIRRLVELEETDPEILREVERVLESRLSQQVRMQRRRVAGLEAVTGILKASDGPLAARILDNLAAHDRSLAARLMPEVAARCDFDDLMQLDDDDVAEVFEAAGPELAITALIGAAPRLIDRVLCRLSVSEAETVRRKLNHPGPIRLSDVESARQQVTELARRLALEGRFQWPPAPQKPLLVA